MCLLLLLLLLLLLEVVGCHGIAQGVHVVEVCRRGSVRGGRRVVHRHTIQVQFTKQGELDPIGHLPVISEGGAYHRRWGVG